MSEILVDPRVSKVKFDREIEQYRRLEDDYVARGWWLVRAEFPEVFVVFGTNKTKPPAVAFGALLDFTNYDLWPPSVRLVDPFTKQPYAKKDLPTKLPRLVPIGSQAGDAAEEPPPGAASHSLIGLMQGWRDDDVPFLCLPGVREYHENPGHTGDSWLLHRVGPEGTLHFILEQLHRYGVLPMRMQIQILTVFTPIPEEMST